MRLWHKTWCETRVRLAIAAGALTALWLATLGAGEGPAGDFAARAGRAVFGESAVTLFALLVIVLGGGSLRQERMLGTLGFTLALPVTRSRLFAVRVAVGLGEVAALALLPAVVVPLVAAATGAAYPVGQALQLGVLWAVCGGLIFAAAVLVATLVTSEYLAWLICFLALCGWEAAVNVTRLARYPSLDLFRIMTGAGQPYVDPQTHAWIGPLPWPALAGVVGATALVLWAGHRGARGSGL